MSQSDFVSRGQALVASGQFQEAVKVCRLGLLGRPTTVEGRVVLGQALLALKRFDEVLAEMRVALELDHTSFAAQILRGEALLRKGDFQAAVEALQKARQLAPTDLRAQDLLTEAEKSIGRPAASTTHPAVSFVGAGDSLTKHYPNHPKDEPQGEEDSGGGYTRPTQLAAASARRRPDQMPPAAELAVGDRSGTVEVDPDLDGVETQGADDDDELAAPPRPSRPQQPPGGARGGVQSSRAPVKAAVKTPTLALEDEDLFDANETPEPKSVTRKPGPGTKVRNAVAMPSGPIDQEPPGPRVGLPPPRTKPPSLQPPQPYAPMPPAYAQMPPAAPLPPAPRLAATLPTMAAMPPPPGISPASVAAAARPTMALSAAQAESANAVDAVFGPGGQAPNWARATVLATAQPDPRSVAAANEPTAKPGGLDPSIQNLFAGQAVGESGAVLAVDPVATAPRDGEMRTGIRKSRSRLQLALWIVIGVVVIGGGVFAGFQIRKVRLEKQIVAAHEHATDLAKADTWSGWTAARDSLAGIVQASSTIENRAALARARALIAFEFGDGVTDAKAAVEDLAGQGNLDGTIAAAYLALAQNDAKAAKAAAESALAIAANDPAAHYVAGQAALLAGDPKAAKTHFVAALDKDARPLYGIALARALAAAYEWDAAIAALDKVVTGTNAEHPAGVIARGTVLAASGRIGPGGSNEVRTQLEKIVAEGARPPAEQAHGVSPAQVAFGDLALAQIDFARGELNSARADVRAAAAVMLDDQRFAEEAVETLVLLSDVDRARQFADKALTSWPTSRRARIALAQIALLQGKPQDAIDIVEKQTDVMQLPRGLTVRGQAHLAQNDLDGARTDFDAALKKLPSFEPALVGRTWVDIADHDLGAAKKRVEEHYHAATASAALTTAYAAVLRASGDPAARDKAKAMLEKVVTGPPGVDVARAQLELARIQRDSGDFRAARATYAEAVRGGNLDARLESGVLLIDTSDPAGGRETFDLMLKEAGDHPTTLLVLEGARARMLVGDNRGAEQLLALAAQASGSLSWKLDRERGRLAIRKGDYAGAVAPFTRALDTCGDDGETFLLAADAATADEAQAPLLEKLKKLAPERLKGRPEALIVSGKLLLAAKKDAEAEQVYQAAKKALDAEKASPRRQAQAHIGLAVAAYNRNDDPTAKQELELVIVMDPSLYSAYLFAAEILRAKEGRKALAYAQRATMLDPDNLEGWLSLGTIAHAVGDRRTLADAIGKLSAIAPASVQLISLQKLRR
ncbi:MAG: Tetratricopeptide 2 repeat protein [Myxococcales bacterium]|nr:Tetratricopeptide 2 repeat protein [Myxococcales bacterium]